MTEANDLKNVGRQAVRQSPEETMSSVTLEEAQAKLPQLIDHLTPGEEVVITRQGQPWAQVKKMGRTSWPCQAGSYRRAEFWMAPDFDAPLDDFREYME